MFWLEGLGDAAAVAGLLDGSPSAGVLGKIFSGFLAAPIPSLLNAAENGVGMAVGIVWARRFRREQYQVLHAVWASMPATAALTAAELTGIPYTMGAHAYDVFEDGGDWILSRKIRGARFLHTSTCAAAQRLMERGAEADSVRVIRRGLFEIPGFTPGDRPPHDPFRILSIGRLVEKKGYFDQL